MGIFKKVIVLSILFFAAGLLLYQFDNNYSSEDTISLLEQNELPVPGWTAREINTSFAVLDALQADKTVFANYYKDDQSQVNLYIGYYKKLEQSSMSHAPQVCFTAQGWIMNRNDKIQVVFAGKKVEINRLILQKNEMISLVYYWYQSGTRIFANLFMMKLSLFFEKLKEGEMAHEDNAFVRISTPVLESIESSHTQLQRYMNDLAPQLKKDFFKTELQSD